MAAADRHRILVLESPRLERGEEPVEIGQQQVGGPHELHVEAGIEHVGGLMPWWTNRAPAHMLGQMPSGMR